MWLERTLRALALAGWVLLAWLATHRSNSPEYFGRYSPEYLTFLGFVLAAVAVVTILAIGRRSILRLLSVGQTLALLLASTTVALLLAEGLVRAYDLLGVSMFEETTRYILELEPDAELVYRHRANLDTVYQSVPFRTNELGLRDRPLPAPVPDEARVLILGDSVTLGWGVPAEATFAARLERELAARLGRPVRTINAGVSGYNTEQELAFLERHIESMAPRMVVLVYVENDVERQIGDVAEMRERWQNPPGANAFLLRWSWLYRLVHFILPDLVGSAQLPAQMDGWERSMLALAQAHRVAQAHDVVFAVFLHRMLPDEVTDALHTDIGRIAASEGFAFFDMLPWFAGVHFRSVVNSFVDGHPNGEGHRIIAEGIARSLDESGVLCRLAQPADTACAQRRAAPTGQGGDL
jgi:lysophospholipase L1-like esterase